MITRRDFFKGAATVASGAAVLKTAVPRGGAATTNIDPRTGTTAAASDYSDTKWLSPGRPNVDYRPVITPNNDALEWHVVEGVKVFHLIAEEVKHEFAPGLQATCWGYNGRVHGPTIEAVEGDRVRIYVTNRLVAPTSVHWHGILLPNGMDGVSGLTQKPIQPGETFKYEFTLKQHGTYMYHPHYDEMTQIAMGMMGLFVIHPRNPQNPIADRDFALMLNEWRIDVGTSRPNPNEMTDFNIFTFNGKVFPGTAPLVARQGERVRIRVANANPMDHHPIHLHGHRFKLTETDGGQIPPSGQEPQTTVLVPVGSTRTVDFVADNPGDWPLHCHMTHHAMNQMGHGFPNLTGINTNGLNEKMRKLVPGFMTMGEGGMGDMGEMGMKAPPNSISMMGAPGPFDYISMGGMFTVLKIRDGIEKYDDPGWYEHPPGSVATVAGESDLKRDGISVAARTERKGTQLASADAWCAKAPVSSIALR